MNMYLNHVIEFNRIIIPMYVEVKASAAAITIYMIMSFGTNISKINCKIGFEELQYYQWRLKLWRDDSEHITVQLKSAKVLMVDF